jgi:hypothetical protein
MKSAIILLLASSAKSTKLEQLDVDISIFQDRIDEEMDYEKLLAESEPS